MELFHGNVKSLKRVILVLFLVMLIGVANFIKGTESSFGNVLQVLGLLAFISQLFLFVSLVFGKDHRWISTEEELSDEIDDLIYAQDKFYKATEKMMNLTLTMDPEGTEEMDEVLELDPTEAGIIDKYVLYRRDGKPMNGDARFFCLRLDINQRDKHHLLACRKAIRVYADAIRPHLPVLANDIEDLYGQIGDSISFKN